MPLRYAAASRVTTLRAATCRLQWPNVSGRGVGHPRYLTAGAARSLNQSLAVNLRRRHYRPGVNVIDAPDFQDWVKPGLLATMNSLDQRRQQATKEGGSEGDGLSFTGFS